MFHRGIAFLIMLSYGLFSMEMAIADVCDGDATAAEVAMFGPGAVAYVAGVASGGGSVPDDAGGQTHTAHSCHCVHGHGSLSAPRAALQVATVALHRAIGIEARAPDAVDLDAHFRPPIG